MQKVIDGVFQKYAELFIFITALFLATEGAVYHFICQNPIAIWTSEGGRIRFVVCCTGYHLGVSQFLVNLQRKKLIFLRPDYRPFLLTVELSELLQAGQG